MIITTEDMSLLNVAIIVMVLVVSTASSYIYNEYRPSTLYNHEGLAEAIIKKRLLVFNMTLLVCNGLVVMHPVFIYGITGPKKVWLIALAIVSSLLISVLGFFWSQQGILRMKGGAQWP